MASPKLRAFRERSLYRAVVVISAIGRRIPRPLGASLGRGLGTLANVVAVRERNKALRNLAIAFPEWSEERRRATIRAMFRHLGTSLFELAWLPNLRFDALAESTTTEGFDRVLEVIDSGRGVVIFTAHCGNWEWLSYATGLAGRPVTVLQRERDQPEMNLYITALRAKAGVKTIDRGSASSAKEMIGAIRRGGILAFVIDQNIRTESVRIPFFGRPALTPIGPARFAVRTGAVVVAAFDERRPDGTHLLRFLEPVQCTKDDDPVELTARMTAAIEEQIRRVPEQWVWMHDRWRERPKWDQTEKWRDGDPPRPADE